MLELDSGFVSDTKGFNARHLSSVSLQGVLEDRRLLRKAQASWVFQSAEGGGFDQGSFSKFKISSCGSRGFSGSRG